MSTSDASNSDDDDKRTARRDSWKNVPLTNPQAIPVPTRVYSEVEMGAIRRGYVPSIMDEKWFIFMEGDRLFAHRSWTGLGVYEATFMQTQGGYRIDSAVVTSEGYKRSSDEDEAEFLESLLASHLLRLPLSETMLSDADSLKNWELAVPNIPKEMFLPRVIKKADPE